MSSVSPIDHALALHRAGAFDAAERIYRDILRADPRAFDAAHMLGVLAGQRGQFEVAERLLAGALAIDPGDAACLQNHAHALVRLGRPDCALADLERAAAHAPRDGAILADRGRVLKALACHAQAEASLDAALALDPDDAEAHLDRAVCRLLAGDFARGWAEYEWRWRTHGMRTHGMGRTRPAVEGRAVEGRAVEGSAWRGDEDLRGSTVLIRDEQGLGDAIQFSRYATPLAARGARVVLETRPPLAELLAGIAGVSRIVLAGDAPPAGIARHCPLMSLPLAFGTRLDTIPSPGAYLRPAPARVEAWRRRLGPKRRARIGIVWSGSARHADEANRAIGLPRLLPLRALGADLFALQREVSAPDRAVLRRHPEIRHVDADFPDTAALICLLDLVVSVDTSLAHLAGALGAPTFLLLAHVPDWRWLLAREDSPWYASMRLFRQPARGDWDSVVDRVLAACRARLAAAP